MARVDVYDEKNGGRRGERGERQSHKGNETFPCTCYH